MQSNAASGQRVVVPCFGETPLDAIEHHVRLEPMNAPDTATLGARDVVIEVKSAQVGWVDLLMTSGQYQHMPKPPYCPGLEYAGLVAWRGSGVDDLAVGDRVLVDGFAAGPRSHGAYQSYGGFATYAVAPREAVIAAPGALSLDQAANLLGNYETAYHALIARGRVAAGDVVLVLGASGSTGLAAVHVAKLLGATVIAAGRSEDKLAIVRAEGADHTVVCAEGAPPMRDAVKALTNGRGADVVFDGVGGDVSLEALRATRFGARFLLVGWASTPFVARGKGQRGAPNANQLPTNLALMKGLDVLGCPTVISTVQDPSIRAPRLAAVLGWAREGKIAPRIAQRWPLADFAEAMRAKWSGALVGGYVLTP